MFVPIDHRLINRVERGGHEPLYLENCPQPLQDVTLLILDTGMRPGEACKLEWADVHLEPAINARFGYIHINGGKSRYAKRNLSLTSRVGEMLRKGSVRLP